MVGFIYFLWNYIDECIKNRKNKKDNINKYDENEKLLDKIL